MRFVVDSMLGTLARYLRVMGYDTAYQSSYTDKQLNELMRQGRVLLTRNHKRAEKHNNAILVDCDLVRDQLKVLNKAVALTQDRESWFSRCTLCNSPLRKVKEEEAKANVPDFVFLKYKERIFFCPSCERFYWPGTHRERTLERLKEWGF
jgi:uncharacterized protein with PIN domain